MCAFRSQPKASPRVFAQRLKCMHTQRLCIPNVLFLCAHMRTVQTHTHTHTHAFLHLCLGSRAWVTARRRLAHGGHEWVPPPAKSCQSHGGRFAPFNLRGVVLQMKGDIAADRPTTVRQRVTKSGESRVNFLHCFSFTDAAIYVHDTLEFAAFARLLFLSQNVYFSNCHPWLK